MYRFFKKRDFINKIIFIIAITLDASNFFCCTSPTDPNFRRINQYNTDFTYKYFSSNMIFFTVDKKLSALDITESRSKEMEWLLS